MTELSVLQFWGGVKVFVEKAHILNRRLCGTQNLLWGITNFNHRKVCADGETQPSSNLFDWKDLVHKSWTILNRENIDHSENGSANCTEEQYEKTEKSMIEALKDYCSKTGFEMTASDDNNIFDTWEDLCNIEEPVSFVLIRRALPKDTDRFFPSIEVIFFSCQSSSISFASSRKRERSPLLPTMPFCLQFQEGKINLEFDNVQQNSAASPEESGKQWLLQTVLPRVSKWCQQVTEDGLSSKGGSLELVDIMAYNALYLQLKKKYAPYLIKCWPEKTDPLKHIHEDLGIATYLLLLWRGKEAPQRFLDFGCGNGLLVYLLTKEGHRGTGFDIKKRKIWDMFGSDVDLREREITPRDSSLDPSADWLIGNHSDELTPWIPVMAARTSLSCNFFLLPCCTHDFTAKFIRRCSGVSQYTDYLDYIQEVGTTCGFVMERDRLRIASTKRVCFVGQQRTYGPSQWPSVLSRVQDFIKMRTHLYQRPLEPTNNDIKELPTSNDFKELPTNNDINQLSTSNDIKELPTSNDINDLPTSNDINDLPTSNDIKELNDMWAQSFVARPKEQLVRNCTKLKQEVKDDLVRTVVDIILKSKPSEGTWNGGSPTPLSSIASKLNRNQLKELKLQCGGLQTLLRNHWQIFFVFQGKVNLRTPQTVGEGFPKRERPCWFHKNHPQGCPNDSNSCLYVHSNEIL